MYTMEDARDDLAVEKYGEWVCTECGYRGVANEDCPECEGQELIEANSELGKLANDYDLDGNEIQKLIALTDIHQWTAEEAINDICNMRA